MSAKVEDYGRQGSLHSRSGHPSPPWLHHRVRLASGLFLVVAGACAVGSAFVPWWTMSLDAPPYMVHLSFAPGNDASASATNNSQSASESGTYHSIGLGAFAALYLAVWCLLLITGIGTLGGGIVALLAEFRLTKGITRGSLPAAIGLILFLLPMCLVIGVPLTQPGIFSHADPFGVCPQGSYAQFEQSPCNSFWGGESGSEGSVSWGAGAGWFLAIGATFFSLLGGVLWRSVIYHPWSREEDPFGRGLLPSPGAPSPAASTVLPVPEESHLPTSTPSTQEPFSITRARPSSTPSASSEEVLARFPALRPVTPSPTLAPASTPTHPPSLISASPGLPGPATQLLEWAGGVSSGAISVGDFAGRKSRFITTLTDTSSLRGLTAAEMTRELSALAKLRDGGLVSDSEYLKLRRAILLNG